MGFCVILPGLPVMMSVLLAQDVQITRDGNDWVRIDSGTAATPQTRVLKITTRGHVVLRGSPDDRVTYKLTERVRARTSDEAHRLFGSTLFSNKVENAMTVVSIMPMARRGGDHAA